MRLRSLGVVMCVACTGAEPSATGTSREAIIGGTLAPHDEAVFLLDSTVGSCTATLIAPRTLLTAQHCVQGGTALNASSGPTVFAHVDAQLTYDEWRHDAGTGGADLALLLLSYEPLVKPLPWNWWSRRIGPELGRIRHVGYGRDENGASGIPRQVEVEIGPLHASPYMGEGVVTGDSTAGICSGDSGGPAFLVPLDGGAETVLAVHSYGLTPACGRSVSILVHPYRRFIEDWLRTHEDAGCPRDDRCVAGCWPEDPDCACAADGFCTDACVDLEDPDCPAFCKTDGLCSPVACPRLDEDCNAPGQSCLRAEQCPGRECISDPQNPNKYCSQRCQAGVACPGGLECDEARGLCIKQQLPYAEDGAACADRVNLCREFSRCLDGTCTALCTSQLDCPKNWFCRESYPRICVAKNVVLRPSALEEPAAPAGCQAAPVGPLLLMACMTIRRRARTGSSCR